MASELNMYESQIVEHRMDIDRLQRELQEVKKKYYLQKKREHTQRWAVFHHTLCMMSYKYEYMYLQFLCISRTLLNTCQSNLCSLNNIYIVMISRVLVSLLQYRERERVLSQSLAPPILPPAKADMPRFTGGGFNLKHSQKAAA